MNQAVVCIAPDVLEAELEVQTLRQAGFATDDISVLWPVLSTLSGIAVGGMAGFLLGLIIGLALPEYEAKKYERKIKNGSTLLAVHTDSAEEIKVAESALKKTSAFGIRHIEEIPRCKPRLAVTGDKNMAKTATMLSLIVLLAASTAPYAIADEAVQVSPSAKKDEQKATMPPDVTSPASLDQATPSAEKAVVKTERTSETVVKTKRHKTKGRGKSTTVTKSTSTR